MPSREARAINELDEDATGRARMEKGDVALDTGPGLAIDQLHPPLRQSAEGRLKIVDDEAEMMQ